MELYVSLVLFVVFLACFIIQLYFLLVDHKRLAGYKPQDDLPETHTPVSVIISARNEYDNLQQNLPVILAQNHPDFEVVVVNDCSFDQSDTLLRDLEKQYPKLKVVTITEHARFKTGKKFAITLGIKAAKNEHLLFTDADCQPASEHWITRMTAHLNDTTQIVLGYSPYKRHSGFLNLFIRFETLKTAVNYLSTALGGNAYMGIGRNLCYTKTMFFKNKGFASHMHVMSGDDDLFVNENATPDNTVIEIHADAHTWSDAKDKFGAYYRQKKRHMGVGKLYQNKHRRFLSLDAISGFLFYGLIAAFIVLKFEPWLGVGLLAFRLLCQVLIYRRVFNKLRCADLLWWLPFLDIIYYLYVNIFGLIGTFSKTKQWK